MGDKGDHPHAQPVPEPAERGGRETGFHPAGLSKKSVRPTQCEREEMSNRGCAPHMESNNSDVSDDAVARNARVSDNASLSNAVASNAKVSDNADVNNMEEQHESKEGRHNSDEEASVPASDEAILHMPQIVQERRSQQQQVEVTQEVFTRVVPRE